MHPRPYEYYYYYYYYTVLHYCYLRYTPWPDLAHKDHKAHKAHNVQKRNSPSAGVAGGIQRDIEASSAKHEP